MILTTVGFSGILTLSGCGRQYDVLDKIADTSTVGESIFDKVQEELDNEASNVTYIMKKFAAATDTDEDTETDEVSERPEYDPLRYVDISKCNIKKTAEKQNLFVTEEDVDREAREQMVNHDIYSKEEVSKSGDIVIIDYTATEKGKTKPIADVKDEERIIGDNLFPDEVDKKLIGVKKGDTFDVEYTFPDDSKEEDYKGKTVIYHITIKTVNGMTLTDAVAVSLSNGAEKTAKEYREYLKSILEYKKTQELSESAVNELCENAKIKGYPKEVLNYDIQQAFVMVYESSGLSDINSDAFKAYVKSLGYKDVSDFTDKITTQVTNSLETEMKVLALAKHYDLWMGDDSLGTAILNKVTGYSSAEDYYTDYSKYHAQYIMARINIAKEMQKNGKETKRAG